MLNVKTKEEVLVKLQNKEDMLKALLAMNNSSHIQEKLHPKLLAKAEQELYPTGVVLMLTLAIYDYCEGLPAMVRGLLLMRIPQFIPALITDEKGITEALALYESSKSA